ncbi:uncharacterized protein BDCG_06388 [Blastomyces dermatitidis ER-3]|uniref:Uncharacterized protein n=1 Tax=Ajellomyces dermatitidis (strain ER-3 / ATCC MYA-2586) TaxID=559297 RepID=A0ABP2F354_AJEDR|nr:uncharacterized protein BDCG_06388 [Blastomyces dermatitidis ER-3]EEQ91268.1 hypothetical protein BDCG_06388 [Blastomyces dermatitidis ER-3]
MVNVLFSRSLPAEPRFNTELPSELTQIQLLAEVLTGLKLTKGFLKQKKVGQFWIVSRRTLRVTSGDSRKLASISPREEAEDTMAVSYRILTMGQRPHRSGEFFGLMLS